MLGSDVGVFYKRRDLSKVVNGKNPIVEHVYMGADVKGKNIIVVDDMIASGSSMIEVASLLKEKGANKIYFA
jgi:ribose-phosphate pyrophosphokinase